MKFNSVLDPQAQRVIDRLRKQSDDQMWSIIWHMLPMLPRWLLGRPMDSPLNQPFYDDKLIPVDQAQGELLFMLASAANVKTAVEFGTSFGISTIYLAAGMHAGGKSRGSVIGSEMVDAKVHAATANLKEAGLLDYVEIKHGDARQTFETISTPVDLLLLDGWPLLALEILLLVEPKLSPGAYILVDNISHFGADLKGLVDHIQAGPYNSAYLPLRGGTMIATYAPST